jgi:hypothetical protein
MFGYHYPLLLVIFWLAQRWSDLIIPSAGSLLFLSISNRGNEDVVYSQKGFYDLFYRNTCPPVVFARRTGGRFFATAVAQILRLPFPLYAMIAAVIVTELTPSQTRKLGMRRLVGTVLGAIFGATLSPLLQNAPWAIALSIMAAMLITHLLRLQDAAKMAGYVCAIVLLNHSGPSVVLRPVSSD